MVPPLDWRTAVLDWQPDPVVLPLLVVAAGAYLGGVRRLARRAPRPQHWAPGRTVAFLSGLAVLAIATMSGAARYDTVLFSVHTAQHIALGMIAPLLLVMGAPITLALQASHHTTQVILLRVAHHPVVTALTRPIVSWVLFAATLFGLYFTPLFDLSLRNNGVHALVHVHFIAVGFIFWWPAVGIDPLRRPLGDPARLLYVVLAVPFHAFLGLAVMSSTAHPLGGHEYAAVVRAWGPSLASDQRLGGGMMWAAGELLGAVAAGIVGNRWYRREQRRQDREDRQLDSNRIHTQT
ncbi:MAG: cytochrome c oxidase assembly protein [Ilumatobacteraceae bacterium]|nr:cytochrome c oxidase assembly protein [Ilumatobacteraceae bacterium]